MLAILSHQEGRVAIVTFAGRAAVDASGAIDEGAFLADGQVVWSWLPDAGVKFLGSESFSGMTVAKKPGHRGGLEAAVKTIARGVPGDSGVTCTLVCASTTTYAHETAGASGAWHSLRPRFGGQGN
jgi:hypothetical protein